MNIQHFNDKTLESFVVDPFKPQDIRDAAKKELQRRALDEMVRMSEDLGLYEEEE